MVRRATLAASLAALVAAPLAHAGTASAATASVSGGVLTYAAAPGEANLVNVSRASGVYTIVDGGASPAGAAPRLATKPLALVRAAKAQSVEPVEPLPPLRSAESDR